MGWKNGMAVKPMTPDELNKYAEENGGRFWRDAGNHWLNDNLQLLASAQVIEIGGYLGNWTEYVSARYDCFVRVYEPVREYYERLVTRFSNRPKVSVFQAAVENFDGEMRIAVMDEGSTFYTPGAAQGPMVPVSDIDRIVRQMERVDLLAINGEGCEYNVLDRLILTGEISRIVKLLVQFHVNVPDAEGRRASIREKLAITHNETFSYPFCWERWERK